MDLKKKQENQVQILKQKQKSDEAAKRLQDEIQSIKAQKVNYHADFSCLLCISTSQVTDITFIFFLSESTGSVATQDQTRGRTIQAVEGLSRKGTAAGTSLLFCSII